MKRTTQNQPAPASPSQQFIGTRVDRDIALSFEGIAADNRRSKSEELRIAIERHIAAEQDARERSAA